MLPRSRRALAGAVAALALCGTALLGAPAAHAGTSSSPAPAPTPTPQSTFTAGPTPTGAAPATYGLGPASAKGIDGRPSFTYQSSPDGRLTDHVALVNYGSEPLSVSLYPSDAFNAADGSLSLATKDQARHDVASWVHLDLPGELTLAPRATVVVPFTVDVPLDAAAGDHAGGLVLQTSVVTTGTNGQKVTLDQRVATKIQVRISGSLDGRLAIEHLHVTYHQGTALTGRGRATVSWTVRNAGNITLGGPQTLAVTGLLGRTGRLPALPAVPALLPGGAVSYSVDVPGALPEVLLRARVRVRPEGVVGAVNPVVHPATASVQFWAVPWLLLVLLVLAIGLGGLWAYARKHRSPRPGSSPSGATPGMALRELVEA